MNIYVACTSYSDQLIDTSLWPNGSLPMQHIHDEQTRLRHMATVVSAWSDTAKYNIPTVPCLSADGHLLVLSVGASRVRYGVSLTFVMVYPTDVKTVLPKDVASEPFSSHRLSLWCFFDDGSVTAAYSYDSYYYQDRASLLDCSLSPFASEQLWKYNKTIQVYLVSTTDKNRNVPILKAFVNVPNRIDNSLNSSHKQLTLCTSPLHNKDKYLIQWIEFHRLVGFHKFVIYNTSDDDDRLSSIFKTYTRKYPNLVDVVQWNFSSLGLVDALSSRYFQIEALHDCLIRYGDQSEWLGMIDLDEYIVPLHPYETVTDYLYDNFGRRIIGSINLWSQFFCTKNTNQYAPEEKDTTRLTIERFTFRAQHRYKSGHEKYLYRPRFVQYLSIHRQIVGIPKQQTSENHIMLAHYLSMSSLRGSSGCGSIEDITIRDRFASRINNAITVLTAKL